MKKFLKKATCLVMAAMMLSSSSVAHAKDNLPGDLNGDGKINSSDALEILEIAVGAKEAEEGILTYGDINVDGVINSVDALLVLQKSVGLDINIASIKISQGDTTVDVGAKLKVNIVSYSPIICDNNEIVWSSSNTAVATVDQDGNVETVGMGQAVITAAARVGSAKASFSLNVGVKATSVSLNKSSFSFSQGNSYFLVPTVLPENAYNKKVTWSSSNPDVASVEIDGRITGHKIGKTTITCKTSDGSNKTASCEITINAMSIPYVSQLPKYPTGCEAASCCMLLKYYKFNVTIDEMVEAIPRKNLYRKNGKTYGPDINEMFVGDPRCYYTSDTPGYGVFSPAVTKSLQKVIDQKGGGYKAVKISGCTFQELLGHISNGQPAIVWATYKMKTPTEKNAWYIEGTDKYFSYPRGTHVMILSGFSDSEVVTVDPYDNGVLNFSKSTFEDRWNLLGKQAIVLEKV